MITTNNNIDLRYIRTCAGHTAESAAKLCGVSLKTWRRYEEKPPAWALVMFSALAGDLGTLSPQWAGWTLSRRDGGILFDSNGDKYDPGYLRSFWFRNQQAQADRATIRALRRKVTKLKTEMAEQKKAAPIEAANDSDYNDNSNAF